MLVRLLILSIFLFFFNLPAAAEYQAKDFSYLKGSLQSIGSSQIEQHLKLYKGYVKKINELNKKLPKADKQVANPTYSDYRALNISRSFAHNGAVLHELYFSNLTAKKTMPSEELKSKIIKDFGSYEKYLLDLKATGKSARSGWAITFFNKKINKLQNMIIDEHDLHAPIDLVPIVVLDVWEHAFMIDYGIDKKSYLNNIVKEINWDVVSRRFDDLD